MTTPIDTATLADEIEALAKKYQEAWDYIRAIPRDCQIPFDKMMELESAERAITRACMDKSATIVAALRELEAVKAALNETILDLSIYTDIGIIRARAIERRAAQGGEG